MSLFAIRPSLALLGERTGGFVEGNNLDKLLVADPRSRYPLARPGNRILSAPPPGL